MFMKYKDTDENGKTIYGVQNEYGIYTLRLYIRGKPWLVTVDNQVLIEW